LAWPCDPAPFEEEMKMTRSLVFPHARFLALAVATALVALVGLQLAGLGQSSTNAGAAVGGVHINMTVKGKKQGMFKGEDGATAKGAQNLIIVIAYQYGLTSPRDPATGLATGKRQHHPVVITHEMGGSSPQFLQADSTNEQLTQVVINFFRTGKNGKDVNYYRVTLTNASAVDVRQYTSGADVLEDVSFTFQKIEQDDLIAKTSWLDDWAVVA
jgi:type VI secretion system secreted protein Hcp